ncbi:MAG TPA: zf-HC2 domain-containing protein [Acidimicrobiales bacterium]
MSSKPRRMFGTSEMASCMKVMRVLQSYLDGEIDDVTARRVRNHLEACRRCGLEAATYREIKASLARKAGGRPDPDAVERLLLFGASLGQEPPDGHG